jgi:hypothetical protein
MVNNIGPRCQSYKTFYVRNLQMLERLSLASLSILVKILQVRPGTYPSGTPFSYSPRGKNSLSYLQTLDRMEKLQNTLAYYEN